MKTLEYFAVIVSGSLLTACGGGSGGGGVNSTPPPPPVQNSTVGDLRANQTFAAIGASANAKFGLADAKVISGTTASSSVSVAYDASTKSYTLTTSERSQTFAPADIRTGTLTGETRYAKTNGPTLDYLTLVTTPYNSTTANRYVGMGYWQRNNIDGAVQTTTFDSFVYGFDTPASAVPRTGRAGYVIDAFGYVGTPGEEPKAFSGAGTFEVDLQEGVFQTKAFVGEYSLASDSYGSGGTILLQGAGHLSSDNGFSGNISYTGFDGTVAGVLSGRFFGPNAEELGASFSADNASGAIVTGSLTGQRDSSAQPVTLSLSKIVADTPMREHFAEFTVGIDTSLTPAFRGSIGYNQTDYGQVTLRTDGSVSIRLSNSMSSDVTLTAADKSAVQRTNFTSYEKVVPASALRSESIVQVEMYKPGNGNGELALTYASFGIWTEPYVNGTYSQVRKDFFVYGLETPQWLLSRRTGSGQYRGIVHGVTSTTAGALQEVSGSSLFDVNFGTQSYTGSLDLTARTAGGGSDALGTWTFGDALTAGQMRETALLRNGVPAVAPLQYNSINPRFYGPDGEEIAATFTIQSGFPSEVGTTAITGVTVAKRQ